MVPIRHKSLDCLVSEILSIKVADTHRQTRRLTIRVAYSLQRAMFSCVFMLTCVTVNRMLLTVTSPSHSLTPTMRCHAVERLINHQSINQSHHYSVLRRVETGWMIYRSTASRVHGVQDRCQSLWPGAVEVACQAPPVMWSHPDVLLVCSTLAGPTADRLLSTPYTDHHHSHVAYKCWVVGIGSSSIVVYGTLTWFSLASKIFPDELLTCIMLGCIIH